MAVIKLARRKRKAIALIGMYLLFKRRQATTRRKIWRKPWFALHDEQGVYHNLIKELEVDDGSFRNYVRLTKDQFDEVVERVTPFIERTCTNFRTAISPGERVAVTLRFLATGAYINTSYIYNSKLNCKPLIGYVHAHLRSKTGQFILF